MGNEQSKLRGEISRTHQQGVKTAQQVASLLKLEAILKARNAARWARVKLLERQQRRQGLITMYDSIEVATVPRDPEAVAGYTAGSWPTFNALRGKFPLAKHVSIAVASRYDADCLDIENGDATPQLAPAWVRRQQARGAKRPILYASLSVMPTVLAELRKAGISRSEVRLWVAHYTYRPHIPVGFDACQWTDRALGRNLDASLCYPGFFRMN